MLVPTESSSAVLVMMSCKSVSICNRSHARPANYAFLGGYPSLIPSFEGNLLTQRHQIISLETIQTLGYHMVKTRSLYLTWA